MKPSHTKLYGLIGLMTLIWSLNYIAAKYTVRAFPPLLVGTLRAAFAAVVLAPIYIWKRPRKSDPWPRRDIIRVSLLGICGIALNQVFFVLGMKQTSVAHAALVIAMTPVLVLLLAATLGQESITLRKAAGMSAAILGIVVLQFGPGRDTHGATLLGDFFVFLASLSFALYTVFSKEITRRHDSLTVNTVGYAAGALAGAPILAAQSLKFDFSAVPPSGWWGLSYMAILSSVVCYLIYYYALSHVPATRVAAFSYAQPVIAATAGLAILNEPVTASVAMGGLLVLAGVWLTGRG